MNIRINKKVLTLLVGTTITLISSNTYSKISDANSLISATTTVNIRLSDTMDSQKIGIIKENEVAIKLLSYDNGWDLIKYNDKIGFVYSKYFCALDHRNLDYQYQPLYDIVITTTNLNFRLSPTLDGKRITTINKNEELETIAITSNNWYLVKYNGKIGYIKAEYTYSLKQLVNSLYPNIKNIELNKYAYATTDVNLRIFPTTDSGILTVINKYESFRILEENNEWFLIKYNNEMGYIYKKYIEEINGTFIIIDLSLQKVVLFKNNNIFLSTSATTGKNETPTNIGLFKIYNKETNRYLIGQDYKSFVEYWMPFDGGIGLHDASWRKKFGGEIYKQNGSHGCVNLPPSVAETIYNNIEIGTKVLVHK